ncbi:hypothetical protein NDU88_004020 [Pleurodeles waltl]|uniref:Uncharacterized protein n=1 Tax=Pleurodeles waltl TaxID=8319 RepID=A0AAV7MAG1_PLEWA|nr:hypothetical protein NDU88_004020 [Pleurodeles waltl]
MPVDCLLENNLEHTALKEVKLRLHLEMLGLPEWACMTTQSIDTREGDQKDLETATLAQMPARRRGEWHGKPAIAISIIQEEADLDVGNPEPTGKKWLGRRPY